jgi:hypothetical protein
VHAEPAAVELPLPESIQVKIKADERKGTIISRSGDEYTIRLSSGEEARCTRSEIETVRPSKKKDTLVIVRGELAGSTGTLIGIDGGDGIVKMTTNADIKILDLDICAKMGDGLG